LCLEFSKLNVIVILEFLIPKYASFQTRPLLAAFRILFSQLFSSNRDSFLSTVILELGNALDRVTLKPNAVSNYFTLLGWVNQVLLLSSKDNQTFTKCLPDLAIWQATLLNHCMAESKKRGLKLSAIRNTRATLRGLFQQKDSILNKSAVESFIRILVESRISPFAAATSLGVLAGMCKRLRNDSPREVINSSKGTYYDFFSKKIIGSKARIPSYVMVCIAFR
jgi:hypothetical protein